MRFADIKDVRILPGTQFYDYQQKMDEYLLAVNADSMLHNFRKAAGLPTGDAEPLRGWDADECKLKGHTTGHCMSGLALAFAQTGDERFRRKLEYIVHGLTECQAALAMKEGYAYGFLSAYSEEQFDLLEQGIPYPEIWAPYYTLDKIMSGLLDSYELAGIGEAYSILDQLGDWVYNRLSRLTDEERNAMWDTYIAGEYGCMISSMVRLFRLTGKPEHLAASHYFENPALYDQMLAGIDSLDGMHANQHIPQIMGALELYKETGEEKYYHIAENFWRFVTRHHCYANGGTGEQERFRAADSECGLLTESTCESCASYNMLRLTAALAELLKPSGRDTGFSDAAFPEGITARENSSDMMAYYENTLLNHILASFSHEADGATTYFMPLAPGSARHYDGDDDNTCCHGTGLESRYRYASHIFSYHDAVSGESDRDRFGEGDRDRFGEFLAIELPVSARLDGDEAVAAEFSGIDKLVIKAGRDMKRRIGVRIPAWTGSAGMNDGDTEQSAFQLSFSGTEDSRMESSGTVKPQNAKAKFKILNGYIVLDDRLKAGESISIRLSPELTKPRLVDIESDESLVCLAEGPYMLAAVCSSKEMLKSPDPAKLRRIDGHPGEFYAEDLRGSGDSAEDRIRYKRVFLTGTEPCHHYFRR